jgi:hypothetical protein
MKKKSRLAITISIITLIVVLSGFGWFIHRVFEGEEPEVSIDPMPEFISSDQKFNIAASDDKRGLREVKITMNQSGREVTVLKRSFPFQGFFNQEGTHSYAQEIRIDPEALGLAQGIVELRVEATDHSRRRGGDGNLSVLAHKMTVDTIPPSLQVLSRLHYINQGGACLVVYRVSSDVEESGVYVEERFFPGYPLGKNRDKGAYGCYFAVSHDMDQDPPIYLWAEDRAGNKTRTEFNHRVKKKAFRKDRMTITDGFLERIIPYFEPLCDFGPNATPVEKYLHVNNELRAENHRFLEELNEKSSPERMWEGPWLRLENAATMARFADYREYFYKGEKIDEKYHMGVDLASLANSPVPASNRGRVLFAGVLGIYGKTVVLDHGQSITSLYGHLSSINVEEGAVVEKGDVIGVTGSTGLAGGDHLHFSIMVNGVPVNPIEWWDQHWIEDNIYKKLALITAP